MTLDPGDQLRLLHRRSEHGYTDRLDKAFPHEPEAVSAAEQRRLTAEAKARAVEEWRAIWRPARDRMLADLDELQLQPAARRLDRKIGALRQIIREIDRGA